MSSGLHAPSASRSSEREESMSKVIPPVAGRVQTSLRTFFPLSKDSEREQTEVAETIEGGMEVDFEGVEAFPSVPPRIDSARRTRAKRARVRPPQTLPAGQWPITAFLSPAGPEENQAGERSLEDEVSLPDS